MRTLLHRARFPGSNVERIFPQPYTFNPSLSNPHPQPRTLNPTPVNPNLQPQTLIPTPSSLHPHSYTLNLRQSRPYSGLVMIHIFKQTHLKSCKLFPLRSDAQLFCSWAVFESRGAVLRRSSPSSSFRFRFRAKREQLVFKDSYLRVKPIIWPRLSCICHIRSTAVHPSCIPLSISAGPHPAP